MMADVWLVRIYQGAAERNVVGLAPDLYDLLGHDCYSALHMSGELRFATHLEVVASREGDAYLQHLTRSYQRLLKTLAEEPAEEL